MTPMIQVWDENRQEFCVFTFDELKAFLSDPSHNWWGYTEQSMGEYTLVFSWENEKSLPKLEYYYKSI